MRLRSGCSLKESVPEKSLISTSAPAASALAHQRDHGRVGAPVKIGRYAGDRLSALALQPQTGEGGTHLFSRFELGKRRSRLAQNAVAERDEGVSVFVDRFAYFLFQCQKIVRTVSPPRAPHVHFQDIL